MNKGLWLAAILFLFVISVSLAIQVDAQEKKSDESFLLLLAARNAWKAGEYEKAVRRYETIIERYPNLWEAITEYGWLLMEIGELNRAMAAFETVLKANPDSVEMAHNYIRVLLNLRRFKRAEDEINVLLRKDPKDKTARLFLSELLTYQMRYNDAKSIYLNLVKVEPGKEPRRGLADVNTALGEYEEAAGILGKLVQDFPDDSEIRMRWVINLARRQRVVEAYKELKNIKDPFLQYQAEAELLNIFGEYFGAEARFKELLKEQPVNYALHIGLTESLLGQADYDGAASVYHSIIRSYPEDFRTMLDFADVLIIQRKFAKAQEVLERILKEYPDNTRALYLYWRLQYLQNQEEQASLTLQQLTKAAKTLPEAKILQVLMLKKRDYKGLLVLSENLLSREVYDQIFLANYFTALLKRGEIKKGIDTITDLLEKESGNSFLATSLSKFYLLKGNKEEAVKLLDMSTNSVERAAMYYKLKKYRDSERVNSEILSSDPNNISAFLGLVKSLSAIDEYDLSYQVVTTFFETAPKEIRIAMALLLSWIPDVNDSYYELTGDLFQKWTKDNPENVDLQIARFNIFIHLRRYDDAIEGYRALKEKMPDNPFINLRLARLLSWDKQYDETLVAYDEYLQIKPYDLNAWREKARFYGWMIEPENALTEYDNILEKYPDHVEIAIEKKAKEAFWREHYRLASTHYLKLLEREPDNGEALLDMGQICCNGLRPTDAQDFYRRLLFSVMPRHRQANLALELSKLYQRPQVMGYGYVDMNGFDDKTRITYRPFTIEGNFTISENLFVGTGYQNVKFDFDGLSFTSDIAKLRFRYPPNHYLYLDGFIFFLNYHKIDQQNINFGTGLSYEWLPGIHMKLGFDRKDLWVNRETLLSNIYVDRYYLTFKTDITKRIDLSLLGDYSHYSDDNTKLNSELFATYDIFQFPRLLQFIFKLNSYGFRRESIYFSPSSYTIWTVAVDWWHFLGFPFRKEYLCEGKSNNLYSLYYGYSIDNNGDSFHEWIAKFSYNITRKLSLNGSAQLIRSDVYEEDRFNGFLRYSF